jgi:hypothetical protein
MVSRFAAKAFRALNIPFRTNSKKLPCNSFVPDLVTRLTEPEDFMPFCAPVARGSAAVALARMAIVANRDSSIDMISAVEIRFDATSLD